MDVKVDGKMLKYFQETNVGDESSTGRNEFETDMAWVVKASELFAIIAPYLGNPFYTPVTMGAKHVSEFEMKYPNDMRSPWVLSNSDSINGNVINLYEFTLEKQGSKKYKFSGLIKTPNLEEDLKVEATLEINLPRSLTVNLKVNNKDITLEYKNDKNEHDLHIYGGNDDIKFTASHKGVKFESTIDGNNIAINLQYSLTGLKAFVTSNSNPKYQGITADANWNMDDGKFKCELDLKQNENILFDGDVSIDFNSWKFRLMATVPAYEIRDFIIKAEVPRLDSSEFRASMEVGHYGVYSIAFDNKSTRPLKRHISIKLKRKNSQSNLL